MKNTKYFLASVLSFIAVIGLRAVGISDYYSIDNISMPKGLDSQVGGLDFMPDGRLVACFHRGEVYTYHPQKNEWKLFADGLQEPLGICAINDREVVVMQRPELTKITDLNGDGEADHYQAVFDDFGMTGNYHEFAFGPAKDSTGNFYIGMNLASNGASIRPELRGEFRHYGLSRENFKSKNYKSSSGRMYAATPYRGWVLKISKEGKVTPFAPGFRSPNGLGFDLNDQLFVTDNQGDWLGTSKLYHVQHGHFYGHPASLTWTDDWQVGRNPLEVSVKELDAKRTRAAVLFPQGLMANSPTQPIPDSTEGKFGPFSGQLLVGEMNRPRIVRVILDKVAGEIQGACVPFYDNAGLSKGNHRFVFGDDGSLWVGQTHLSWAGGQGLQRIRWNGKTPLDVRSMELLPNGFKITFTKSLEKSTSIAEQFQFKRYYYEYRKAYGSPQYGIEKIKIIGSKRMNDNKTVMVYLDKVNPGFVYQLDIKKLIAEDNSALVNPLVCYTLNRMPNGDDKAPHLVRN